jgi:hypothetical protein
MVESSEVMAMTTEKPKPVKLTLDEVGGMESSVSFPSGRGSVFHNAYGNPDCTAVVDSVGEVWFWSTKCLVAQRSCEF